MHRAGLALGLGSWSCYFPEDLPARGREATPPPTIPLSLPHTPCKQPEQRLESLLVSGSELSGPRPAAGDTPQAGSRLPGLGSQAEPSELNLEPSTSLGWSPTLLLPRPLALGAHPQPQRLTASPL